MTRTQHLSEADERGMACVLARLIGGNDHSWAASWERIHCLQRAVKDVEHAEALGVL